MSLSANDLLVYLHERAGLPAGTILAETPLFTSNLLDSLSLVDLIVFVESKLEGARIDPDDVSLDNFDSVELILRFAERKRAGA